MKKPKVLITGGLGFIFSWVTQYFIEKGYEVLVIDPQYEGSHPEIIDGTFQYINKPVQSCFQDILEFEPEYIVHAGAISAVDYSIENPLFTIEQNSLANLTVFEAARHCTNLKKLLYISTDEVAGECNHRKTEDEVLYPRNPYAMSKAHGSLLRLAYDNTYPELRNKTAETRFCNVFGERQDPRKVIPRLIESIRHNSPMPIHNGGKGYREYLYVKNIPPLIDLILEKGDRVYNVTLNEGFTVDGLIEKVEEITGKKVEKVESHREGMDLIYQLDNNRIMELGWKPLYTFEEGLNLYLKNEGLI